MTNFDISRYDVKRICSSSTLIAGELAKRSPRADLPLQIEDSPESSALPPGGDEVVMIKGATSSPMSNSSSSMEKRDNNSPRNNSTSQQSDCCDLSQAFFYPSAHASAADCSASASQNGAGPAPDVSWMAPSATTSRSTAGFPVVHQLPMFALWND